MRGRIPPGAEVPNKEECFYLAIGVTVGGVLGQHGTTVGIPQIETSLKTSSFRVSGLVGYSARFRLYAAVPYVADGSILTETRIGS